MADPSYKPKALLFDLLTGLTNSWAIWDASAVAAGYPESAGHVWRKKYLDVTYACGEYKPYELLVRQSATEAGLSEEAARQLIEDKWGNLEPWPETKAVLEKLRERGYKLGVVTNCSKELGTRAAEAVGIKFDAVVTAEEAGYYKPRKEAYLAGIDALGLTPDEVLFVAGSSGDVVGATDTGMKVVWNNHIGLEPKSEVKPLREAKTLDEALAGFL